MPSLTTPMTDQLPLDIRNLLTIAAQRLGRGLEEAGASDNNPAAPCHEVNSIFSLMHGLDLADVRFKTHAVGTLPRRSRVDLVAVNGHTALAVVAQAGFAAAVDFPHDFRPTLEEVSDDEESGAWWDAATERWGIQLNTTYADRATAGAWVDDSPLSRGCIFMAQTCDRPESWLLWDARRLG